MGYGHLAEELSLSQAITITAGASGSTAINGTILDMAGYDGVLVEVQFGAITAGAATSIKMQQDISSTMGGATDLEGTSQTIADDDDDKLFYIDLKRPKEQYVRLVVSRATQASTCAATYKRYRGRNKPSVHGSNVAGEKWVSPAEGTA